MTTISSDVYEHVAVLGEIARERTRQDAKWGEQNHPDGTGLHGHAQQVALIAQDACKTAFAEGEGAWRHILWEEVAEAFAEFNRPRLRAELVQVAAVAVAWIEAIDRRVAAVSSDTQEPQR